MKLLTFIALFIINNNIFSQDCSSFYYFQSNKTIELTIINGKGKESGKMIYKISNSDKSGSAIIATIHSEFINTKGEIITSNDNKVQCVSGMVMMDMKIFIPASQQEQIRSGSATANEVYLEYPYDMKVGDQLKDGKLSMDYEGSGGLKSSIEIEITDRKVEGKETVTTPAGTWECYKISTKNRTVSKVGEIGIPINLESTEWFAPGFGVVKTESKTGKTEITAIN